VEGAKDVPFPIRRVYWIYDVPGGAVRGGHAYRTLEEVFVSLSGSFDLTVDDGQGSTVRQTLNRSYYGVYVPAMRWRQLENFSTNGVCLIFASQHYDESDYVRDYQAFCELRAEGSP
jgi:oxalate decarboxylase/phosphoglucose isomerase-like protein (cupin superfamily)